MHEFIDALKSLGFSEEGEYLIRSFRIREIADSRRTFSGSIRIHPDWIREWLTKSQSVPYFQVWWDHDPVAKWHRACWEYVPRLNSSRLEAAWAVYTWPFRLKRYEEF